MSIKPNNRNVLLVLVPLVGCLFGALVAASYSVQRAMAVDLMNHGSDQSGQLNLEPRTVAAQAQPAKTKYRTAKITRGRLVPTLNVTGTLQPEELVDVGAQVSGPIKSLGKDPKDPTKTIDYGAQVEEGTVLAQIDPAIYQAQLKSAEADLKRTEAEVMHKKAVLKKAKANWERAKELFAKKGISRAEFDITESAHEIAEASLQIGLAQVEVAKAARELAATNLKYTTITSPVKGTIIDRRVNVGQTVVVNLTATSMFLIAKDLSKLEVWEVIKEADVGKVKVGQLVSFKVSAFPDKVYKGKVKPQGEFPVRLNASLDKGSMYPSLENVYPSQEKGVVTYTAVVTVDNNDGKLLTSLTADLSFVVADKKDVLLVPAEALTWQPKPLQIAPEAREAYLKHNQKGKKKSPKTGFVWLQADGGFVRPVEIHIGLSDSQNVEIVEPVPAELKEGIQIVIGSGTAN
jgi:HlyD family secretion protein